MIAMTASVQISDRDQCRAAGMNDFTSKPIERAELFETIRRMVGRPDRDITASEAPPAAVAPVAAGSTALPGDDDSPVLQLREAAERLGGDTAFLKQLAHDATQQFGPDYLTGVSEALAQGRKDDAKRLAHTLKGVAGTLGAADLQRAAQELESAITSGEDTAALDGHLAQTGALFAQALAAIHKWLEAPVEDGIEGNSSDTVSMAGGSASSPTGPEWEASLEALEQAVALRDPVAADTALEGLGNRAGAEGQLIMRLRQQLEDFDFDGAGETLHQIPHTVGS